MASLTVKRVDGIGGRDGGEEGERPAVLRTRRWRTTRCPTAGCRWPRSGRMPVTDTVKLVDVVVAGSELTVLVGGVVSISHDVDRLPVPGLPYWSSRKAALTENE